MDDELFFDDDDLDYPDMELEDCDMDDDGQPDWEQEWHGLADAGFGTDEDYGYFGDAEGGYE